MSESRSSASSGISDELLSAYIDGQVTAAERARVEQALADDPQVQGRYQVLEATVRLLQQTPQVATPRAFVLSEAQVLESGGRVRGGERQGWWGGWLPRLLPVATIAVAVTLIVIVGFDLNSRSAIPAEMARRSAPQVAEAPAEEAAMAAVTEEVAVAALAEEEAVAAPAAEVAAAPLPTMPLERLSRGVDTKAVETTVEVEAEAAMEEPAPDNAQLSPLAPKSTGAAPRELPSDTTEIKISTPTVTVTSTPPPLAAAVQIPTTPISPPPPASTPTPMPPTPTPVLTPTATATVLAEPIAAAPRAMVKEESAVESAEAEETGEEMPVAADAVVMEQPEAMEQPEEMAVAAAEAPEEEAEEAPAAQLQAAPLVESEPATAQAAPPPQPDTTSALRTVEYLLGVLLIMLVALTWIIHRRRA